METCLKAFLEFSSVSHASLALFPEWENWVLEQAKTPRTLAKMRLETSEWLKEASSLTEKMNVLRRFKRREMILIGFQDWIQSITLPASIKHLSDLAELCIDFTAHFTFQFLENKGHTPSTSYLVLGLGKLGGRELNYSSDVDLILLYGQEGQLTARTSYHQWFEEWARLFSKEFTHRTEAGSLFRLDLRLRPEGDTGPLTRSLESAENYYAAFGETWERLALMKARRVAGSEELAYEFQMAMQPFCYPKNPSPEVLQAVAHLKHRIETELLNNETRFSDIKRGIGGIREIEFILQVHQLLYGGKHAFLQEVSTLKSLEKIGQTQLMPTEAITELREAYLFFRHLEHRLQMREEAQTHEIPQDFSLRQQIATSLGFETLESFDANCQLHRNRVRHWFKALIQNSFLGVSEEKKVVWPPLSENAKRTLHQLREGPEFLNIAPRTKQLFRQLEGSLAQQLQHLVSPSDALIGLEGFVERYGSRGQLYETWLSHPKTLELLLRLFDSSEMFRNLLVTYPDWLETICRESDIDSCWSLAVYENLLTSITSLEELRLWRWEQGLRIAIQNTLQLITLEQCELEHTALGEACLRWLAARFAPDLIVIGAGKLGGGELSYGSDFDLVFLEGKVEQGSKLLAVLTEQSSQGILYHADVRLRPEGEKGVLTLPAEKAIAYYKNRAQTWEFLAFTKFRLITNPHPTAKTFFQEVTTLWKEKGRDPNLIDEVLAMKQKIEEKRAHGISDNLQIKTGCGGIIDIEFAVQTWQMRKGFPQTSTRLSLKAMGEEFQKEAEVFQEGYDFLRKIESTLRKWDFIASSHLPEDKAKRAQLALRAQFSSESELMNQLQSVRRKVRASFESLMQQLRH